MLLLPPKQASQHIRAPLSPSLIQVRVVAMCAQVAAAKRLLAMAPGSEEFKEVGVNDD